MICIASQFVKVVLMENKLQIQQRAALFSEMCLLKDMIENIDDVRIYGIVTNSKRGFDTIDLPDYFSNFPFDWKTEIKILLTDGLQQYQAILNESE